MRDFNLFIEELLSKNLYQKTWSLIQYLGDYYQNNEIEPLGCKPVLTWYGDPDQGLRKF